MTPSTFVVPAQITCMSCGHLNNSVPEYMIGKELPIGTHSVCTDCDTIMAVVPDGTVICTLDCDFYKLGSHPCN